MNERHQAQLLEAYLQALRQNPNASPPPHLDASTATFARKLVRTQATHPLSTQARARIWYSALDQANFPPIKENQRMNSTLAKAAPRQTLRPFTAIASLLLFGLIGVTIVMMVNLSLKPDNNEASPALAQATASEEAEATENLRPTLDVIALASATAPPAFSTPILGATLNATGSPFPFTPTAVPFFTNSEPYDGYVAVVTTFIDIPAGTRIREDMLVTVLWPVYQSPSGSFQAVDQVIDSYASTDIARFMPVLDEFISGSTALPTFLPTPSPTWTPSPTHTMTPQSR